MTSNREKKRIVQAGVKNLLSKPGWDPRNFKSGTTGVDSNSIAADNLRHEHADSLYRSAGDCPDCVIARAESGDETALCGKHLKAALGMG